MLEGQVTLLTQQLQDLKIAHDTELTQLNLNHKLQILEKERIFDEINGRFQKMSDEIKRLTETNTILSKRENEFKTKIKKMSSDDSDLKVVIKRNQLTINAYLDEIKQLKVENCWST